MLFFTLFHSREIDALVSIAKYFFLWKVRWLECWEGLLGQFKDKLGNICQSKVLELQIEILTALRFSPSVLSDKSDKFYCQSSARMFSTSKILSKEQMEELQNNPFFDKYAEKIAQLQK